MGAEPAPRALLSPALSSCAASPPLRGSDLLRLGWLVALAVVTLAPVRHHVGSQGRVRATKLEPDSFPLSTYPMFSEDRLGRVIVPNAVGFTAEGEGVMPHCTHFGAGGLDQVRKQIARPVRAGRADRVAQSYADSLAAARCPTAAGSGAEATCGSRGREARSQHVEVVRNRSPRGACAASAGTASRLADAPLDAAQVANALVAIGLEHCVIRPLNSALQLWTCSPGSPRCAARRTGAGPRDAPCASRSPLTP